MSSEPRAWRLDSDRCLVIAEVAQAHDGSLGMAHAFIDAVARTGADAVKFQTHIAAAESTAHEPWRVKFSLQDRTRADYWARMQFTEEQWRGLIDHATERGLLFLSSPFSVEAMDLLLRIGVRAWKVASGEVASDDMFDRMLGTGLPVLLSTGMSPIAEIDRAVERCRRHFVPFAVMQCASSYPCPPEAVGLNLIQLFKVRYGCPVGLSDHSGTIFPALAAATMGVSAIEVHVTLSREMFGPDVPASVTTGELRQLVEGVRFIERMTASPVDKDAAAAAMSGMRALFTKSVVPRVDLSAGAILRREDLALKKPGTGIPAVHLPRVLGRRLKRDVCVDQLMTEDDLEIAEP